MSGPDPKTAAGPDPEPEAKPERPKAAKGDGAQESQWTNGTNRLTAKDLANALGGKPCQDGYTARCPAHDDANPSLSICETKDAKLLVFCHAGCEQDAVLDALRSRGLWPEQRTDSEAGKSKAIVATYDYIDEHGSLLFQAVRFKPKSFRQRQPDGKDDWIWNVQGVPVVPYRLPEVLEATAQEQSVFVVEGEKDCDNLADLGIPATCNAGGAQKWRAEHSAYLADADIVIIPDNDKTGRDHAESVAASLKGIARRIRILNLPGLPEKEDVSYWLEHVGTVEDLWALVDETPDWQLRSDNRSKGRHGTSSVHLESRLASEIEPEPVEWLWHNRIPLSKLSLLGGHPGEGKSVLSIYLAAIVSKGGKWPDGSQAKQGKVIILSAEDDAADTIVPRLIAAGANLENITIIESAYRKSPAGNEEQCVFDLATDLEALEEKIQEIGGARLIIIDVIDAYLGATDTHRNAAVRGVLGPLKEWAAEHRCTMLGITHFRKEGGARAVLNFIGSVGFIGHSRSSWIVTIETDDEGELTGRRLFLRAKGNLTPDIGGLAYRIEGTTITDKEIETPKIIWDGPVKVTADEAIIENRSDVNANKKEIDRFLTEELRLGAVSAKTILKTGENLGFTSKQLYAAKKRLNIDSKKSAMEGGWSWYLQNKPDIDTNADAKTPEDAPKMPNSGDRETSGTFEEKGNLREDETDSEQVALYRRAKQGE